MEWHVMEFHVADYDGKRPIIIYGAAVFGEYTLRALQSHCVEPLFFVDREKCGKEYLGKPVYDCPAIERVSAPIILLASGAAFAEIYRSLQEKGEYDIYSVHDLIFRESELPLEILSQQAQDKAYFEQLYLFGQAGLNKRERMRMFSIDWVITERCSLKCRDCSNLMQYYECPVNFEVQNLVDEMERLLIYVDEIMDVRVLGGEPFMHPQIAEIMHQVLESPQIRNFSIYTNATIMPGEDMLPILKNKKVKLEISDYGTLAKNFPSFIELMEREHIRHHVVKMTEWHKLGELRDRGSSVADMKKIFANCYCNNLITMIDGKVYRCPVSANGRTLEAIPYVEDDIVDLYGEGNITEKLKKLVYEKEYDVACGYCNGRNYHLGTVEPAVQIKKPLPYEKCRS